MLSDLLNTPTDERAWEQWGLSHALIHQQMIEAIAALGGPSLDQVQLYPFPPDGMETFLERNQRSHSDINGILGLVSVDFHDVDLSDQRQLAAWVQIHHANHFDMAQRLGIQG